jgi:hypothetical protein
MMGLTPKRVKILLFQSLGEVGINLAAAEDTVEAKLRAPRDANRGAAASSFMNDRRSSWGPRAGDMFFLSESG